MKDFYPSDVIERVVFPIQNNNLFWKKENALFKKLITKYPNKDFWKKTQLKTVPSLAIYINIEAEYLRLKYQEFHFQPETIKEEKSIIEDLIVAAHNNAKVQLKSIFGNAIKELFSRIMIMILLILVWLEIINQHQFILYLTASYFLRSRYFA